MRDFLLSLQTEKIILCFISFDEIKTASFDQSSEKLNYLKLKSIDIAGKKMIELLTKIYGLFE